MWITSTKDSLKIIFMKKILLIAVLSFLLSGCEKKQKTEYKFTCEGTSRTSYADIGLSPEHDDKQMFIDEYNLRRLADGKFLLQLDNTNVNPRPTQINEQNFGHLTVTNSVIKFKPRPPFIDFVGDIRIISYEGMISLNTGNFSSSLFTKFRGKRVPTYFKGQCFGLEGIKDYIKR